MATATSRRRWSEFVTCRRVLNLMVILGFMFNYMLRVNLTIAIVEMIMPAQTNHTNVTAETKIPVALGNRYNWTSSEKNDILGSFYWGYILTELPGGRMAEIVGAKRIFGGGMLLASLLTLLTPVFCDWGYYAILILRALVGFALGATWPSLPPMAAKWIPPLERSKFMANMMASALGAAITLPVCGFLISISGWECVFYVTGAVGVIWSLLWFVLVFDSPAQHPRISQEEKLEIETKIAEMDGGPKHAKPDKFPYKALLTCMPVWAIIVTHGCSVYGYFTVVNQLPTYMKDVLHFNIKENGLLSSLPYLSKYIMAVIASWLADKIRQSGKLSTTVTRKMFTTLACSLPAALMVIQAIWGRTATLSVTVFTSALFFNGAVTAGYLSNVLDIAPNFSGTIFGMANTLSSIAGFVSTKVVAVITETESTFQTWRYIFWMLAGTYSFATAFYLIFGTGKLQKFNSIDKSNAEGKELQPLRPYSENEKEREANIA